MKAQRYNAYDVQVASKTDPAARYVLASDYEKLEVDGNRRELDLYSAGCELNEMLDRLRCEFEKWQTCDKFTAYDLVDSMRPILYPTPENNND